MKTFFILIILSNAVTTWAQQNLFNVPNSEITKKNDHFFQQQLNLSSAKATTQLTYDYGLGHDMEVGVNLYNLVYDYSDHRIVTGPVTDEDPSTGPMGLINFQKGIKLREHLYLGLGTQTGRLFTSKPGNSFAHYEYANLEIRSNSHLMGVIGVYNANRAYQGEGSGHLQLGLEAPIIQRKFHFVGDYLSGTTDISQLSLGFCAFPTHYVALSFGQQFSVRDHYKPSATIFELTLLPDIDLR